MKDIHDVYEFLKNAGIYYLATVDNHAAPHVRPFGTILIYEDHLYFQTGMRKQVVGQLQKNPNFEICATMKGSWIRVSGKAYIDERIEAQEAMLDAYPALKKMYQAGDGNTVVFRIEEGYATLASLGKTPDEIHF